MSLWHYASGWVALIASVGLAAVAARRLSDALLAGLTGSLRWVGQAVLALSVLLAALELTGIIGVLSAPAVLIAVCAICGLVMWRVRPMDNGPAAPAPVRPPARSGDGRAVRIAVVVVGAIVAAPWLGWTVFAYRHGMETVDTLWYHMPFAARFVQSGSILGLHYVDSDPVVAFYPANSELFHALGLAAFHSDWISPVLTLGWAGLAVIAGWAIGRPYGREHLTAVAVLAVLGTTDLITSQPGGAYNDVVCLALMLSAASLLAHGAWRLGPTFVAALAAGLAAGTKVTMLVPAVVLAIGVALASPARTRWRGLGVWVLGTFATGGYWFVRNLADNGNPLGAVHLGPLPAPRTAPLTSIASFLTSGHAWSTDFLPGLRAAFGPVWWLLLGLIVLGVVASLTSACRPAIKVLACAAVVSLISLALSPQTGEPGSFRYNLRYETPAMALGLVLLTLHPRLNTRRRRLGLLGLLGAMVLATELDGGVWPTHIGSQPLSPPLSGAPALVGVALAVAIAGLCLLPGRRPGSSRRHLSRVGRRRLVVGALAGIAVGLTGGFVLARSYANHRYRDLAPLPRTFAWAQSLHHTRIGITGIFDQYALYGTDSSNYVQFIGEPQPHAGFGRASTCEAWRTLVDRGRYDWLVVAPPGFPLTLAGAPENAWTSGPSVTEAFSERAKGGPASDAVTVYRVRSRLPVTGCRA